MPYPRAVGADDEGPRGVRTHLRAPKRRLRGRLESPIDNLIFELRVEAPLSSFFAGVISAGPGRRPQRATPGSLRCVRRRERIYGAWTPGSTR